MPPPCACICCPRSSTQASPGLIRSLFFCAAANVAAQITSNTHLADTNTLDSQQQSELRQLCILLPQPDGTMVRSTLPVPRLHKSASTQRKPVAAIRIPDLKNRTRHRLTFSHHKLQRPTTILRDRKQSHRPMLHRHLNRKPAPHLPMKNSQRPQLRSTIRNRNMTRPIMAHQHNIILKIRRIILSKRATSAKAIQNLHRLNILDLKLASNRNPASSQQTIPNNDRTDRVLVLRNSNAFVVVRQRSKPMLLHQSIHRNRSPRSTLQLSLRAIRLHIERLPHHRNASRNLLTRNLAPQRRELIDLHNLHMRPKHRALQRQIAIDIQHPAVVMSHHAHSVVLHRMRNPRSSKPILNLNPSLITLIQHSSHLMEWNPAAPKHISYLRNRTSLAMRQPLPGHLRPVLHPVERRIVDSSLSRQVQQNHRNLSPSHHRQHSGRKRISSNMQEDKVNIALPERMSRSHRLFRRIDHAQVNDLSIPRPQPLRNPAVIPFKPLPQPRKLAPICLKPNAEQPDAMAAVHVSWNTICRHGLSLSPYRLTRPSRLAANHFAITGKDGWSDKI